MKLTHLIAALLLLSVSAAALSSCENQADTNKPDETTASETADVISSGRFDGYVIMRSDLGGDTEIDAAVKLKKAMIDCGCKIELTTDWVKRGESIPDSAPEILVGATNRAESEAAAENLKYDDFTVEKAGERIVITGGSEAATMTAVDWFIENALGYTGESLTADGDTYSFKYDYAITEPLICGEPLANYSIAYDETDGSAKEAASSLQTYLLENTGYLLELKKWEKSDDGQTVIAFFTDSGVSGYAASVSGNTLKFTADGRLNILTAGKVFMNNIKTDGKLNLDNKFELNGAAEYAEKVIFLDAAAAKSGDGSQNSPYLNFSEAQTEIETLATTGPYHFTVKLAPGSYILDKTIEITGENLGKYCSTVDYICEGESPAVLGAWTKVGGFTETTVNGIAAWEAPLPEIDGELLYPNQMFSASGERLNRPRLPKTGFYYPVGVPGYDNPWTVDYRTAMTQLIYAEGDIPTLTRIGDIQMRMFHYWDDEKLTLSAVDYDNRTLTFTTPSGFAMLQESSTNRGAPYFLDNVFEALDSEGEIYADRESGKLYYIPKAGEKLDGFFVYVSNLDKIMTIDGMYGTAEKNSLTFKNISFAGSDWSITERAPSQAASDIDGAVTLNNSSYVSFENCGFEHIGTTAVKVITGVNHLTFDHCKFNDLGAGGIHIQGVNDEPATENVPHDLTISDCYITSYGRVYANGVGILLRYAYDCLISHNNISDGYYSGISCGWVWGYSYSVTDNIIIEYNHIYDIGQKLLSDMGGIYTLGAQPNTVIRNNLIHDIQMACYGGWGIYPDEGSSDILIEKNICYNFSAQPFHQHYGKDNIVRNNIFAFGEGGAFIITRKEEHNSLTLERNILVSDGVSIYAKAPSDFNFKDDSNLVWDYSSSEPVCGYIDYDVFTRKYTFKDSNRVSVSQTQSAGLFKNVLVADPLFKDAKNGDFTLSDDSPAYDIGFEPIDMSEVGVR